MSERFECVTGGADIQIVPWSRDASEGPWAEDGGDSGSPGDIALVIGNPWASALSVEDTPEGVLEFLDRARGEVQQYMARMKGGGA